MSTVRAPETCPRCRGEERVWLGKVRSTIPPTFVEAPCPDCCCPICGNPSQGECGECWTADDTAQRRKADR